MKPWLEIDEVNLADPQVGRELQDLFAAHNQKRRIFQGIPRS